MSWPQGFKNLTLKFKLSPKNSKIIKTSNFVLYMKSEGREREREEGQLIRSWLTLFEGYKNQPRIDYWVENCRFEIPMKWPYVCRTFCFEVEYSSVWWSSMLFPGAFFRVVNSHEINLYSIHGRYNDEVLMYTSIWNRIFSDTKMRPCSLDIMAKLIGQKS